LPTVASGLVRADNRRVTESPIRVVLADDDVLLREGPASLLDRSGLEVAGQAGDAAGLIEVVRQQRPELAVVDIRMPPKHATEGLDAARVIQREFPQTAVVVLSAHVEVEQAMDLIASGHRTGYLLKSRVTDVAEFIDTLKRVVRGGSAVDPALVQELVAARRADDPLDVLTSRGAGGARPDGGGTVQCRDRAGAVGDRGHGRKARAQHHDEAPVAGDRRDAPAGARRPGFPGNALTQRLLLAAMRTGPAGGTLAWCSYGA
jgi:DNA-binding NarL/FixJ family response regulator